MLKTLPLFPLALSVSACTSLCGEKIVKSTPAPDGKNVMIWHSRDCGATTVPKTTVYIIPENKMKNIVSNNSRIAKKYKAFSFERHRFEVFWVSNSSIKVEYDFTPKFGRKGSFFSKNNSVGDVHIEYVDTTP